MWNGKIQAQPSDEDLSENLWTLHGYMIETCQSQASHALNDGPLYHLSLNGTMIYKMNIVLLYKVKLEIETINI